MIVLGTQINALVVSYLISTTAASYRFHSKVVTVIFIARCFCII